MISIITWHHKWALLTLLVLAGTLTGCATLTVADGYVGDGKGAASSIAIDPAGRLPTHFPPLDKVQITAILVNASGREVSCDIYYSRRDGKFALVVGPHHWQKRLRGQKLSYRLILRKSGYQPVAKYIRLPLNGGEILTCLLRAIKTAPPPP